MSRRTFAGISLAALACGASAQSGYPGKPLRWVVATAAGGGSDVMARMIAAQMSKQLGQQIVIENRPGGASLIASEYVARSTPDGYTLYSADNGTLVNNTALFKKLPYRPDTDFAPLGLTARFPLILATHPQSGLRTMDQLVQQAKAHPASLSVGTSGIGSPHHLALEMFKHTARLDLVHVPYKGGALSMQDAVSGQIPLVVIDRATANPMLRTGKLMPLASFSGQRSADLPQTPTLLELGLAAKEVFAWQGVVVASGTPGVITDLLSRQLQTALEDPSVRQKMQELGVVATPSDAAGMRKYWNDEAGYWVRFIKEQGISLD
ncbi:MAG: tripartite tricarboxylate transporter substrate binding protein [Comamonas sp.]|jgi:tripartite-type tricarboxylate transporter receptor subunit TctC|nr:tripartite tricarboxylate transporter substrate binding protein [Comamonas sp.]